LLQLERAGEPNRRDTTAARLNEPRLAADWGLRMFPIDSSIYRADHYNTGSVFPYLNNFAIVALFERDHASAALQLLRAQIALSGFSGLGFVPEHLVGDRALAARRGVPHQIFSSSCIVESTLRGWLGIELASLERGADSPALTIRPTLVAEGEIEIADLRVDGRVIDLRLTRERDGAVTRLGARFELRSGAPIDVDFAPRLPPLSHVESLAVDGRAGAKAQATLAHECSFEIVLNEGPRLLPRAQAIRPGAASSNPRIVEDARDERSVTWHVWGVAGTRERFWLLGDRAVRVAGARPCAASDGSREIEVEFGEGEGFVRQTVRAELAE
jgi:hypothetical protein